MSFVLDQIRRIDAQLDRLQLANIAASSGPSSPTLAHISSASSHHPAPPKPSPRVLALQAAIRGLSPGSSTSRALLRPWEVEAALSALSARGTIGGAVAAEADPASLERHRDEYERELEWLLVSKATTQVYGHVLSRLLDETVGLAEEMYYWDAVLASRPGTVLYGVQVAPARLWEWMGLVWEDVRARRDGEGGFSMNGARREAVRSMGQRWTRFYCLVRQVVNERSVAEVQKQVLSPVTRLRGEIRQKQANLKKVRLRHANALGVLLGEGMANDSVHGDGLVSTNTTVDVQQKFKSSVARNVALIEAVLATVNDLKTPINQFDAAIGELTEDDPLYADVYEERTTVQPNAVAERLTRVLAMSLPQYARTTTTIVQQHGRPSRIVRYWLPIIVGILSSSTILRIVVNRKADIIQWVQDLGSTMIDFWSNWVIEPTRKVIQTIRHDEGSEVSIMSKRSLEGDRASLERMVLDFAIANPSTTSDNASNTPLTESQLADLRLRVREGDLTPVLKAYEKDLASPFLGAVRGNLIRALLIQIQKTKVDVEVAIGGIDTLLKSQELVFGFVGLTPGLLVTYAGLAYLRASLSTSSRGARGRRHGRMLRQLRNIDRLLTHALPTRDGELLYKDQGLLLADVHVLRQAAERALPREIYREFGEDADELCDVRMGVARQRRAAERIRWAYGRFFA
nr:nuclear control of atpase protein 2 [Quercus suber]